VTFSEHHHKRLTAKPTLNSCWRFTSIVKFGKSCTKRSQCLSDLWSTSSHQEIYRLKRVFWKITHSILYIGDALHNATSKILEKYENSSEGHARSNVTKIQTVLGITITHIPNKLHRSPINRFSVSAQTHRHTDRQN